MISLSPNQTGGYAMTPTGGDYGVGNSGGTGDYGNYGNSGNERMSRFDAYASRGETAEAGYHSSGQRSNFAFQSGGGGGGDGGGSAAESTRAISEMNATLRLTPEPQQQQPRRTRPLVRRISSSDRST